MKNKVLSVICFILPISYIYAAPNGSEPWHVLIKNNTESPISVGGLITDSSGHIRGNCWWTDPNVGENGLWKPDQPLESESTNVWLTYQMTDGYSDCEMNGTYYMEFMINKTPVSLNRYYTPNEANDHWDLVSHGTTISTKSTPNSYVGGPYVEFDYNGPDNITAQFAHFNYTPIQWHVEVINHTESPISLGGLNTSPDGNIKANCWLSDNSGWSNNQLFKPNQQLSAKSTNVWLTDEMSSNEANCGDNQTDYTHYMEFMINSNPISLTAYYHSNPGYDNWGVIYNGITVGTKSMPHSFNEVDVKLDYYNAESIVATFD